MLIKRIFWLNCVICFCGNVFSQDVHFSQGLNFPLLINPSLGGQYDGTSRLVAAFRNQNISVPNSSFTGVYNTIAASYETKLFKEYTGTNSLAMGIVGTSDYAGSGTLATNDVIANVSYRLALDRYGRSSLSAGIQGGITSRRIFSNDLLFESQVNEFNFDPSLPNLEKYLDGSSHISPIFGIGTHYNQALSDNSIAHIGLSIFNVTSTNNLMFTNSTASSYARINIHTGVSFDLDESMTMYPSIIYMKQGPHNQFNAGMSFQKSINDDVKLIGGLRSRIGDAFIVIAGLKYLDFQTTFSYDFTTSGLSKINKTAGAFELNISYIFGEKEESYNSSKQYCPSF